MQQSHDLNSNYTQQTENCNHEDVCPHCEWANDTIDDFIDSVIDLDIRSEEFIEEVLELIEYVEYATRKQTLLDIAGSLLAEVDDV